MFVIYIYTHAVTICDVAVGRGFGDAYLKSKSCSNLLLLIHSFFTTSISNLVIV